MLNQLCRLEPPSKRGTKRNYYCGQEEFGSEKLWILRGLEVAVDQGPQGYTNGGEFVHAGLTAAAAMGTSGSTERWAHLDNDHRKRGTRQ